MMAKATKKRVLSLLMTLVLVLSLLPVNALAEGEESSDSGTQVEETTSDTAGGEQADASTDGEQADVPTDGEQADVPTDGEQADVPTDGEQADAPTDGEQTADPAVPTDPAAPVAPVVEKTPEELAAEEAARQAAEAKAAAEAEAARQVAEAKAAAEAEAARQAAFAAAHPEITGEYTYNDTTVYVTAPVGAFAAGTTLSIQPVKNGFVESVVSAVKDLFGADSDTTMSTLMDNIQAAAGEDEQTTGAVAFDITFTDADGNEVQPDSDYPVDVRFEVASDSELVTDGQQLQVFHMEDAQSEATPVGEPVVIDPDAQTQTVAVSADSFSIYAIGASSKGSINNYNALDDALMDVGEKVKVFDSDYYEYCNPQLGGTWETSDTTVLTVSSQTVIWDPSYYAYPAVTVNAVGIGTATITYTNGSYTCTATVTVEARHDVTFMVYKDNSKDSNNLLGNATITLTNTANTSKIYKGNTGSGGANKGKATISGIPDGTYTVSASRTSGSSAIYQYTGTLTVNASTGAQTLILTSVKTYDHVDVRLVTAYTEGGAPLELKGITGKIKVDEKGYDTSTREGEYHIPAGSTKLDPRATENSVITFTAILGPEDGTPAQNKSYDVRLDSSSVYVENTLIGKKSDGKTIEGWESLCNYAKAQNPKENSNPDGVGYCDVSNLNIFEVADYLCGSRTGLDFSLTVETIVKYATNTISGTKMVRVNGASAVVATEPYTFELYQADTDYQATGVAPVSTTNDTNGKFSFDLTFTKDGAFYYIVKEKDTHDASVDYDPTVYGVKVEVSKQSLGGDTIYTAGKATIVKASVSGHPTTPDIVFTNVKTTTTDFTFTKAWTGNADRPAASSIGVSVSDGTHAYTGAVTTAGSGTLTNGSDTVDWSKTVDGTGTWSITVSGLPNGTYGVTETAVNSSYFSNDKATDGNGYWTVSGNNTSALTNTYYKYDDTDSFGSVTLRLNKTGADGAALSGATFGVYKDGICTNQVGGDYVTNDSGYTDITLNPQQSGDTPYYLKETHAPDGYQLSDTVYPLTVTQTAGKEQVGTPDGDYVVTRTTPYTATLASSTLTITDNAATISNSLLTGTLEISKELSGGITASDLASGKRFTFNVYKGSSASGTPDYHGTVAAGGKLPFDLPYGTYTIEETNPGLETDYTFHDVSYSPTSAGVTDGDDHSQSCTIDFHPTAQGATVNVTATNEYRIKTGSLTVSKTVENKDGDSTDFIFTVQVGSDSTDHGNKEAYTGEGVYKYTLQSGHDVTLSGIPYGTAYTVTETANNAYTTTYKANGATAAVSGNSCGGTISSTASTQTVEFTNHYITGNFTVTKVDAANHDVLLSGAEFLLSGGNLPHDMEVTTTSLGEASFTGIPAGNYTLTESKPPENYVGSTTSWLVTVDGTGVSIEKDNGGGLKAFAAALAKVFTSAPAPDYEITGSTSNNDLNLTVYNTHETGVLTINKTVSITGGTLPEGYSVTFKAYDKTAYDALSGETDLSSLTICGETTLYGTDLNWPTGSTVGTGIKTMNLNTGSYEVVETVNNGPSDGNYTVTETNAVPVTVTTSGGTADFTNTYVHKTGKLKVKLVVSPADYALLDGNDVFTFTGGSSNVTIRKSDLKQTSGTGNYTCTKTLNNQNTGRYGITEYGYDCVTGYDPAVKSTSGSLTGNSTINVPVTAGKTTTVTFTNSYKKHYGDPVYNSASFRVYKTDGTNPIVPSTDVTQSAGFTLYEYTDGTRGEKVGNEVFIDSAGYATFSELKGGNDESSKTYLLQETTAPTGYTQSNTDGWFITINKTQVTDIGPVSENNSNVFKRVFDWLVNSNSGENGTFAAADESTPATLTVTNARVTASINQGTLTITKAFSGLPDGVRPDSIKMTVTNRDNTFSKTVTLDGTVDATETSPWTAQVSIPGAGTYTVTEDSTTGNAAGDYHRTGTTYNVNGSATQDVTIDSNYTFPSNTTEVDNGAITVTNAYTRDTAALTIVKTFEFWYGNSRVAAESLIPQDFRITLTGEGQSYTLGLTGSEGVQAPDEQTPEPVPTLMAISDPGTYTWTVEGLPTGHYTITESGYNVPGYGDPTASLNKEVTMKDFSTSLDLGANQQVALTNTYDRQYREMTVTKTTNHTLPTDFQIAVAGEGQSYTLGLTGSDTVIAPDTGSTETSYTWTLNVPTGDYTAAERNYGVSGYSVAVTVTGGQYDTTSGTASFAVTADGEAAAVEFTNTYTQNSTPYTPGGGGGDEEGGYKPTTPTTIDEQPTPLAETPQDVNPQPETTDIPDEETPLAATPAKTGDDLILWVLAAGVSGIGLVWVSLMGRKRRDDGSQN